MLSLCGSCVSSPPACAFTQAQQLVVLICQSFFVAHAYSLTRIVTVYEHAFKWWVDSLLEGIVTGPFAGSSWIHGATGKGQDKGNPIGLFVVFCLELAHEISQRQAIASAGGHPDTTLGRLGSHANSPGRHSGHWRSLPVQSCHIDTSTSELTQQHKRTL
eukprot:1105596-Pelagomonas_calceolata.AAC.3